MHKNSKESFIFFQKKKKEKTLYFLKQLFRLNFLTSQFIILKIIYI